MVFKNHSSATNEFKNCEIVVTEGKYFLRPYAWAFQKHSPYLAAFNFYLQEFIEKGTWNQILGSYEPLPQVCPDMNGKPLEWPNVFTAFLFLIGGAVLALLCFAFEFVVPRNLADVIGLGVPDMDSTGTFTMTELEETIVKQVSTISNLQKQVQYFKNLSGMK